MVYMLTCLNVLKYIVFLLLLPMCLNTHFPFWGESWLVKNYFYKAINRLDLKWLWFWEKRFYQLSIIANRIYYNDFKNNPRTNISK